MIGLMGPLEAVLFAAGSEGLSTDDLSRLLDIPKDAVVTLCHQLAQSYTDRESGLQLVEIAGAWQIVTRPEHASYLMRLGTQPTQPGLSQAALEVLALVAYHQPVSRAQIESIRGVQSDGVVQNLAHRQLIKEVGRLETPGRPILYGTTPLFLQSFGLRSLDDLPPLPDMPADEGSLNLFDLGPTLPRD